MNGSVGFSGHADLAAEAGASVVFVINPLVPNLHPSMGFEARRAALRYGYASTQEWLDGQGAALVRRLASEAHPAAI